MGITTRQVEVVTCDICKSECGKNDGGISIQVSNGDGRDVGPATITGTLAFYQPYVCQGGIVCRKCKLKFLERYLQTQQA